MSEPEKENDKKFLLRVALIFSMLIMTVVSVTFLAATGKVDFNTYEKIMSIALVYVAGFASGSAFLKIQ